ncbi:MAG: 1-phosphofructokinase family hexose kinase [Halanaerobiales bacterium]
MIITVTLNPALDMIIQLDKLNVGELNRFDEVSVRAGGKGINVARVLSVLKKDLLAMSIMGGHTGKRMQEIMDEEGINFDITPTAFNTRENIKIVEGDGQETEVNQYGQVSMTSYLRFKESLRKQLEDASILILSGSIPDGLSPDIYQELILLANEYGVKTILDTSGEPLRLGIESKPYIIKPNLVELSDLIGRRLNSMSDVYQAMQTILAKGVENIIVSVGEQGAFYANKEDCYQVVPPEIRVADTTVGAGDSMVAGLAIAIEEGYDFLQMAKYVTSIATLYVSGRDITDQNIAEMKEILEVLEGEQFI